MWIVLLMIMINRMQGWNKLSKYTVLMQKKVSLRYFVVSFRQLRNFSIKRWFVFFVEALVIISTNNLKNVFSFPHDCFHCVILLDFWPSSAYWLAIIFCYMTVILFYWLNSLYYALRNLYYNPCLKARFWYNTLDCFRFKCNRTDTLAHHVRSRVP